MAVIQVKVPNWLDIIFAWPVMIYRRWKYGYEYRRIYLSDGEWTIVDQQDYYRFGNLKWGIRGNRKTFYAVRFVKTGPGQTKIVNLHRGIMSAPEGVLVDHINGCGLDNRRANLRLATYSQNACNRRRDKSKTTSRFVGVSFKKLAGCWVARISYKGKALSLGSFDSEIEAAKAYDEAAKKYHGEFARINFPESAFSV